MKKILSFFFIAGILVTILFPTHIFAGTFDFGNLQYQPLAPIPGVDNSATSGGAVDLNVYLAGIFKLGIGLCVIFAVLMIIIGGFEYVLTDKVGSKEDGKKYITNAIVGLLLALSSYIILYTINPCLLSLDFTRGASTPGCQQGTYQLAPAEGYNYEAQQPSTPAQPGYEWQFKPTNPYDLEQGGGWYQQKTFGNPGTSKTTP